MEKLKNDALFRQQSEVFMKETVSQDDIIKAGETSLVLLCNGSNDETLNDHRLEKFTEKSLTSTTLAEPKTLPPTSSAAKYHSLRVYQQIQVWKGNEKRVPPLRWGWEVANNNMIPIMTDIPPLRSTTSTGHYPLQMQNRMLYHEVLLHEAWHGMHNSL